MASPALRRWATVAIAFTALLFAFAFFSQPQRRPPSATQMREAERELEHRSVIPVGNYVAATRGGLAEHSLAFGFLQPEEDGTWMSQLSAYLYFEVDSGREPIALEIDLQPLIASDSRKRVVTFTSSSDDLTVEMNGGRQRVLVALNGESTQSLVITCDKVQSPISLELSPDRRALCAKVFGYQVIGELQE